MARTLKVDCSECGKIFEVPASMKSGLANCPHCKRAVEVPGGAEPLFWFLLFLGLGVGGLLTFGLWTSMGSAAGITAGIICGGVIVVALLAS